MFRDKSVIITGASSGLGAALALELARHGAKLALFAFDERQKEVAEQCRKLGSQAIAVIGDVTRPEDGRRLVETAIAELGAIDALIVNAGISMWSRFDSVEDVGLFRKLIEVNYLGAVNCIHPALPHIVKARGTIAAITSIQAKVGVPLHTGYVASKHALQGFCDSLRIELDGTGVNILTVLPHWLRGTELRSHALGADGGELGGSARKHGSDAVTVDAATKMILAAMTTGRRELYIPSKLRLLVALNGLSPVLAESLVKGRVDREDH